MKGAVADGITDCTAAIQDILTFLGSVGGGNLLFPPGTYLISATLNVPSNVTIDGSGATIICTNYASVGAGNPLVNVADGVENVEIKNLTIDGGGSWTATPFANPYGGGNSVGFTNRLVGIQVLAASNISIHNNVIAGVETGIYLGGDSGIVANNVITTNGMAAIRVSTASNEKITGNTISGVLGNMTAAGDASTASSKFADGVYIYNSVDVLVAGNEITNCIRIGVVCEGNASPLTDRVIVCDNTITNMNSCRGTENNAGIWFETNHTGKMCLAYGNVLDNTGAIAGANPSRGLQLANGASASNNKITGFLYGVTGNDYTLTGGEIWGNTIGIIVGTGRPFYITGAHIHHNLGYGIQVVFFHNIFTIQGCIIEDNGVNDISGGDGNFGIFWQRNYADQTAIIKGNTFISSANEGDTAGQLVSIGFLSGGLNGQFTNYVSHNSFVFRGTFTDLYPANLSKLPSSLGITATSTQTPVSDINAREIVNDAMNYNVNGKLYISDSPLSTLGSWQGWTYRGGATAAPTTGSYNKLDYFLNTSAAAGGTQGWVCVTAGTPGTRKTFGPISS